MKIISITNGNWSSSETWDNGVPDLNDVVYINHNIYLDINSSTILDLYINRNGILNCGKNLKSLNITLIGGQIVCDEFAVINCTLLKSINENENENLEDI